MTQAAATDKALRVPSEAGCDRLQMLCRTLGIAGCGITASKQLPIVRNTKNRQAMSSAKSCFKTTQVKHNMRYWNQVGPDTTKGVAVTDERYKRHWSLNNAP
jgi:hypothetical protein